MLFQIGGVVTVDNFAALINDEIGAQWFLDACRAAAAQPPPPVNAAPPVVVNVMLQVVVPPQPPPLSSSKDIRSIVTEEKKRTCASRSVRHDQDGLRPRHEACKRRGGEAAPVVDAPSACFL